MQKIIDELTRLSRGYDGVSMSVMDAEAFEKFFGRIYVAVNTFRKEAHTPEESSPVVDVACQLLELAVEHHRGANVIATENAVKVFEQTVQWILSILSNNLNMNENFYQEARTTRLQLNALKACGILPPGHFEMHSSGRFSRADQRASEDAEALRYAQENLVEFTRFVYNLGLKQDNIPDPFSKMPESYRLTLYSRAKLLASGIKMIQ